MNDGRGKRRVRTESGIQRQMGGMANRLEEPMGGVAPEGEGDCQLCRERFLLSFLTCVGKTQDFWLLRLLRLWDIWDQRLFLSNVGDLI